MATKKTSTNKSTKAPKATTKKSKAAAAPVEASTTPAVEKKSRAKKAKADTRDKKLSALDAAAQVLAKASEPMTTGEMIEAMATKRLWLSPGGKTPAATLYSAILREINVKGREAQFRKTERGHFAING